MCFRLFFAIVDCLLPHPGFSKHHQFNPVFLGDVFHAPATHPLRIGLGYLFSPPIPNPGYILETKSTESETCFLLFDILEILEIYPTKKTAVHHKSSWFILTWISSRSWNKEHGKRSNHRCRDIMPMADRQKLTAILLQLFQQLWSFWRLKLFVPVQIFPLNSYPPLKSWKNSMSITKEDASGWLGRCEILTNFVLPPHFRDKQRIF